jgi:hypothetical protein
MQLDSQAILWQFRNLHIPKREKNGIQKHPPNPEKPKLVENNLKNHRFPQKAPKTLEDWT